MIAIDQIVGACQNEILCQIKDRFEFGKTQPASPKWIEVATNQKNRRCAQKPLIDHGFRSGTAGQFSAYPYTSKPDI